MAATDFFELLALGHALNQEPFSIEDWYVGLWTNDPTATGSLADEVVTAEYQRLGPIAWDSSFANTSLLSWVQATTDWGDITHVCLLNSPTKSQGNMLVFQDRDSLDINIGVQVQIAVGGLVVTLI